MASKSKVKNSRWPTAAILDLCNYIKYRFFVARIPRILISFANKPCKIVIKCNRIMVWFDAYTLYLCFLIHITSFSKPGEIIYDIFYRKVMRQIEAKMVEEAAALQERSGLTPSPVEDMKEDVQIACESVGINSDGMKITDSLDKAAIMESDGELDFSLGEADCNVQIESI